MTVTQNSVPVVFIFHPTSLCYFDLVPLPWFFPSCSCTMSNKVDLFTPSFHFSPSPRHSLLLLSLSLYLCIISHFFFLSLSFICSLLYSCHVSILSAPIYPLPHISLRLFPFTPPASDSARQPLSAWVKSSGPTSRAKPWVCFPSERLLFAHSGNYWPSCIVSLKRASTSWSSRSHYANMLDKTSDCSQSLCCVSTCCWQSGLLCFGCPHSCRVA